MAAFFQSFRTSAMPKRLLRYAMARFDIFEDDALDLENLDLGFGLRNTFEFKDVGLKVEKLTKQLALPPEYRIKKAKVSRLQITVPLDLYSSSIELTAVGVHISLEISSTDGQRKSATKSKSEEKVAAEADVVPTAADLAQSFLETQPSREKRALEEALAAEKQDLGASVTSSEDGEDDPAFGTGQGLSLPAFLTDFLQGVVDRTGVTVRDVAFHLDIEVPVEPKSTETELVSLRVSLDELHVEGVTTQTRDDGASKIVPKEGKRHILLSDIRACLISQADIFSSLTRSPSMASTASRSPEVTQRSPPSPAAPFLTSIPEPPPEPAPEPASEELPSAGTSDDASHSPRSLEDSEDALHIPYETDDWNDPGGAEEQQQEPASSVSTPRASIYHDFGGHLDSSAHSSIPDGEQFPWPSTLGLEPAAVSQPTSAQEDMLAQSPSSDSASDDSGAQSMEDLAQSHYFSHEEAQSMYMSAFSTNSQHLGVGGMPGSWDSNPASPEQNVAKAPSRDQRPVTPQTSSPVDLGTSKSSDEPLTDDAEPSDPVFAPEQEPIVAGFGQDLPAEVTPKPSTDNLAEAANEGSAKSVKELLSLGSISVYVPTKHKHLHVASTDGTVPLAESAYHNLPGAFSVHTTMPQTSSDQAETEPQSTEEDDEDDSIEVHFAPLECRFDASIGFLLAMVVQRLLEASKRSQKASEKAERPAPKKAGPSMPNVKVSVQKISVLFMEKIFSIVDATARAHDSLANFGPETLLRAEFENLQASTSPSASSTETNISLEKFRFGYHDSDILSFNRDAQMRTSVRDAFPEAGADISVKMTTSPEDSRCEVTTLPLGVHLDLQRLDETFNWFGGLSGFLQMSASMTSSASPEKPAAKPARPRGVRFDIPASPESTEVVSESKTNVRIGGLELDLVGKRCGVRVRSTAVKISNRQGNLGVAVGRIQVSGPHNEGARGEPPIDVLVGGARLDFLSTPRDVDLDRLLALITPSKGQFDGDGDDEIMVDTLLRQRRKGSVLNLKVDDVHVKVGRLHQLDSIPAFGEELAQLGAVAKYLPEDDRPGLLTLGLVDNVEASVDIGGRFGVVNAQMTSLELAHITFPSLAAIGVNAIKVDRNRIEELVGSSNDNSITGLPMQSPVLTVRMIGDQMEPVIKVRMRNINFEYRVPTIMDALGLSSETTPQEFDAMLAQSVANFGERAHHALVATESPVAKKPAASKAEAARPTVVNVAFRNCLLGLNPLGLTSKLAVLLLDSHVEIGMPTNDDVNVAATLRKAAILLVDDASLLETTGQPTPGPSRHRGSDTKIPRDLLAILCSKGYANICQISSTQATVKATTAEDGETHIDAEIKDNFVVLETCADSFHTLIALAGALKPPTPPSKEAKYQTEVVPMQDMLQSIAADAFGKAEGDYNFDDDFALAQELGGSGDLSDGELVDVSPLGIRTKPPTEGEVAENIFDATSSSMFSNRTTTPRNAASPPVPVVPGADLGVDAGDIDENFFAAGPSFETTAHTWDSARNTFDPIAKTTLRKSPLKVRVRDVHVIWNLFDGYDWQQTRDAITKTVEEVEVQAFERRRRSGRRSLDEPDFEDEDVIGDCLFNSIYVSIPANHDPRELVGGINHLLDDTESIATTTMTQTTTRTTTGQFRSRAKKLRLGRSRRHKITFELSGVNVDLVQFPPGTGETLSSVDVRVNNLEVFDHVPTSTWKKFATYNLDAGERELGQSMAHIQMCVVKPRPHLHLAASEISLKATVLPLRLHVDQDALDFIKRFFEFKDESQAPTHSSPSDEAFIQRAEILSIPVVLDFKPKRVDYAGLRGGRTSEFMNFVILERASMTLRHTIIHSATGWERLGTSLNDLWTPDITRNQLAGVLAGVAPLRHLVNVGSGFRDLIEIPIKEYKKDGRIVRSIGMGAAAFARTTGTEVVKLGAKMAIGTQNVLQGAEGLLSTAPGESSAGTSDNAAIQAGWEEEDMEPEERKYISPYADQPTGVVQGLRLAYGSLTRDLHVVKDALIAVPGEVMESGNAQGAVTAVARRAPTILFRPAIGLTRATGQVLLGATNTMDKKNLRRVDEKYKPGLGG